MGEDWIFQIGTGYTSLTTLACGYASNNKLRIGNYQTTLESANVYNDNGKWVHLVFTYQTGTKRASIYYNGVLIAQTNFLNELNTNSTFYIGRLQASYYQGRLEDCRIYFKELLPDEVLSIYNETEQLHFPPQLYNSSNLGSSEIVRSINNISGFGCDFNINNAKYGNGTYELYYTRA